MNNPACEVRNEKGELLGWLDVECDREALRLQEPARFNFSDADPPLLDPKVVVVRRRAMWLSPWCVSGEQLKMPGGLFRPVITREMMVAAAREAVRKTEDYTRFCLLRSGPPCPKRVSSLAEDAVRKVIDEGRAK